MPKFDPAATVVLQDGEARYMGDGVVALLQRDEAGEGHSVIVSLENLKRVLSEFS